MIPTQASIELPLLKVLSEQPAGLSVSEAVNRSELFFPELTENDKRLRTTTGEKIWKNRVCWCRQSLVSRGELKNDSPRGIWEISNPGLQRLSEEWAAWEPRYSRRKKPLEKAGSELQNAILEEANPEEEFDHAYLALRIQAKQELLARIMALDPYGFEQMMAIMLECLGYGKRGTGTLVVTSSSGDGGIDIVCSRDPLGVEKYVVQVKRHKKNIQRPDLQRLEGARSGERAKSAIFITTSDYSTGAQKEAERTGIHLINGDQLTELCLQHRIGVRIRTLELPAVDNDFFEELE